MPRVCHPLEHPLDGSRSCPRDQRPGQIARRLLVLSQGQHQQAHHVGQSDNTVQQLIGSHGFGQEIGQRGVKRCGCGSVDVGGERRTHLPNRFWRQSWTWICDDFEGSHGVNASATARDRSARTLAASKPRLTSVVNVVYVMSLEPESGKSLVSLGIAETLSQRVQRLGYFRPVISSSPQPDPTIELMRQRYKLTQTYEESFGITTDMTRSVGSGADTEALISSILAKFEILAARCDAVLIEGTDFTGASAAFEFDLNARVATNLGAPVVLVLRGHGHRPDQVRGALSAGVASLEEHDTTLAAVIVNRVDDGTRTTIGGSLADFDVPLWMLPEEPRLAHPTIRQTANLLGAEVLSGDDDSLAREVAKVKVAAMTVPHLIDHLVPGLLLISAGDRADVIMAALVSQQADSPNSVAGILLTGGLRPEDTVMDMVQAIPGPTLPILLTGADTYATVTRVGDIRPATTSSDSRRIALSLGLFETHVDSDGLAKAIDVAESSALTPLMFEHRLLARARSDKRRIVLPEGSDDRVLQAAERILQRDVCGLVILDQDGTVPERATRLGLRLDGAEIIAPHHSDLRDSFAEELYRIRSHKGMSADVAYDAVGSVSVFGTMMVHLGIVDGMVSGASHTTADTIRPALQIIRTLPGVSVVSSVFLMCLHDRVLVYGDCAVNPDPDASQLADIAISSAQTAAAFNVDPLVAMLSYSTGASGSGGDVEKVREATEYVRLRAPDLRVEGPIQYDAAVDASVAASKLPDSEVAGRATVFVFPDLNTGNNTYKAVQRSAGAVAIGPILQGLRKPVNDLSRGCTVSDIFNTVAITAVQAQFMARESDTTPG